MESNELVGLVGEVKVIVEEGQKAILADIAKLQESDASLERFIKEVEAQANKARYGGAGLGVYQTDALRAVIPQRHVKALERLCRTPGKLEDKVRQVAMESWLKNSILLSNPQVSARVAPSLLEEMDKIERALGFEPTTKASLQEDTASEGGYLVPVPLEAEVLRMMEDGGIMRGLCRILPMVAKTHNIPNLATNVTVAEIAEEATITASEPTFGLRALTAVKFAVRAIASMELVQDSAIGILAYLIQLMSEKYALLEDQRILEGTGSGGQFTGVVAAASVNEVTNLANGALVTSAKIMEQKWKARKRASRRGAAWIAAPEILQQIEGFRADSATTGPFLYQPSYAVNSLVTGLGVEGAEGVLHGFPIFAHSEINVARTVGSGTNCSNIYFGPWRSAVIIGDLLGLTFGVSEHTQWATGQLDLRMIKRTAGLVAVPEAMTKQTGVKIA